MAENDPNRERRTLSSAEILALADRLVARANSKMMEDTPSQRADSVLAAAALRVLATEHLYDGVILDERKRDIVPSLSRNL